MRSHKRETVGLSVVILRCQRSWGIYLSAVLSFFSALTSADGNFFFWERQTQLGIWTCKTVCVLACMCACESEGLRQKDSESGKKNEAQEQRRHLQRHSALRIPCSRCSTLNTLCDAVTIWITFKRLLISCRVAERWITVRGLSYICNWPLSTSAELSAPWRPVILLLIDRQLVMLHTWQQLHSNVKTTTWQGDNRGWPESGMGCCRLNASRRPESRRIIYYEPSIDTSPWFGALSFSCGFVLTSHSASGPVPRRDAQRVCCSRCRTWRSPPSSGTSPCSCGTRSLLPFPREQPLRKIRHIW